jgi:hypothetical protein
MLWFFFGLRLTEAEDATPGGAGKVTWTDVVS